MSSKRFRVAFSFPGEKRDFVREIAGILAKRFGESAILYDGFHRAEFARADLAGHLSELYQYDASLVVVIVTPDYRKKEWCGLELKTILEIGIRNMAGHVMFCRFGHANPKDLYGVAGFLELEHLSPNQTARLILDRLELIEGTANEDEKNHLGGNGIRPVNLPPNNLPRLHSFFGREKELQVISGALSPKARTWGALIDGPGGIGKTSLAIRAAQLAGPRDFDRIFFLSAKDRQLTSDGVRKLADSVLPGYLEMMNELARLLNLSEISKQPESERAHLIIHALEQTRALLIFDNLESLPKDQQNRLFDFLTELPHGCKAIATSRRRTDVDARILRLERLGRDAAMQLLAELAKERPLLAKTVEADRIRLYEETGGSPLLLHWIAGQLGRGRCRDVASALDFIRHAPDENDPLEFIFGDLLETFTASETKVLAALSYFSAPVEVKFIAELGGMTKTAAQTALRDLSNRALVVPDETEEHFALVPLVGAFLKNARPEVVKETGDRLEKRAYALIVENGFQKHDRFPALEAAWPGIAPALALFLAGDNARLQTVCTALADFLHFQGHWDEWLALCEKAEARAVAAADHDKAGWRAYQAGFINYLRRQADAVLTCAERAAAHWVQAKAGARERAFAIRLRGIGHQLKGDYPAAITVYREALELRRSRAAESEDMAIGLNDLANAECLSGDLAAAEGHYREALRVARAVGHAEGVATYTGNLADLALAREDWPAAETLAREALPLSEAVHRQQLIARNNRRLARALMRQGKAAEALPHARCAVEIYTHLGSPDLAEAQATLAECEQALAAKK